MGKMAVPFLGQIQPLPYNFAPRGWAQCDGQLLPISQNTALFSLLGTFYGGNGQSTFALPDLRGRVPIHFGSNAGENYSLGQSGGVDSVTLTTSEMPAHTHAFMGSSAQSDTNQPEAAVALAQAFRASGTTPDFYGPLTTPQPLNAASVGQFGQSQPHDNMQPYLAINWCIALQGVFPSRN
jgi:microcystin-dependent protein